jgi:cell division protein FtsQ
MTPSPVLTLKPELTQQHRQRLRQQRRNRFLKACWQMVILTGAVGGLILTFRLPFWYVQSAQQVKVRGNRLIQTDFIVSQLPLEYPVSLLNIHPNRVSAHLMTQVPLIQANVTRQLWPATLRVEVQERLPVALTIPGPIIPAANKMGKRTTDVGVLDAMGTWLPLSAYQKPTTLSEQAPLRVLGFRLQDSSTWPTLYQSIRSSPVKITAINWKNPQNIILDTALGSVYLGAYSARFSEQLKTLDQIRQLSSRVNAKQIDYIDLSNPSVPAMHLKRPATK